VASSGNHGDDSGDYHVTSSVGSNGVYYGSVGDGSSMTIPVVMKMKVTIGDDNGDVQILVIVI
jgi:hypothetical protein